MKYKRTDIKDTDADFPLKLVEKKVPFNKDGEQVMYHLRPRKMGVIEFEDLAKRYIRCLGINEHLAVALSSMISEGLCEFLKTGHAVNIGKVGTLKPVVKCKAQLNPHDCSVDDVKSIKLQFFPCKPINEVLGNMALRVENRKEFLQRWDGEHKAKRKKKDIEP